MNKMVTIIITTWNSLDYLKLNLESLREYTEIPHEIVIVDNGSDDGTKEYINSLNNKEIVYIRNHKNLGTIKALQIAEKFIKTRFMVLLDSDSIVSPNWLSIFLSFCESNPQVRAIGPIKPSSKLIYPYRNDKNSRQVWDEVKSNNLGKSPNELLALYCGNRSYAEFVNDFTDTNKEKDSVLTCPPEILSGCCTFLDYDFIKPLGGLTNDAFKDYGVDDADRCWRIARAGGLVIRTGKVYVHHFEGSSLKKNNLNYRPLLYKNNRVLLDLWSKEFWDFVVKSKEPLFDLAGKYWLVRELLLSARLNQIPEKFRTESESLKDILVSSV